MVASIEAKILDNRRFTISTLSNDFPEVSRSVMNKIVSEKLHFKKLYSRWVPKLLTEDHKNKRFECSLNFLTRYNEEGDATLSRIVKGDETWVSHVTPESKIRPELYWTLLAREFWTPYSPDFPPSDFHLFRHLKHHLGGNHYNDDEDVKTAVTSWLSEQAASFYEEGIQNLVARYDKCLNKLGSFVEKWRHVCRIGK
ncbi:hypothetical protein AVEN_131843-1 [Araneus ventricosus]|uniref:Histone-lysine N-methyltransferase SETMAR n=1 Tax=Araneus ventricosus TaxID=182803 RepID=A0A4Y2Q8S5_ARAVE|nr:hypothetical protein AVEN_131843-1 [Araneus ventricosus]